MSAGVYELQCYVDVRLWAGFLIPRMSRQFNSKKALTLFGDRVSRDDLETVKGPIPLSRPPGLYLVYEVAEAAGITVFHG